MTVLALVRTELQRLTSTPLARLALAALMTVPLLYGGLYLWANQDPYANLDRVPAAIVDADAGAVVDGTATDYGRDVTEQVLEGGDFDWHEVSAEEARRGLDDGTYDFTFTIPSDFSADLASSSGDDPTRAQIVLSTNDTNSYLSTTIAEQAAKSIRASVAERVGTEAASQLLVGLSDVRTSLGDAATGAGDLNSGLVEAVTGADQLVTGAADASTGAHSLGDGLDALSTGASSLDTGLQALETSTTGLPGQAQALADGAAQVATGDRTLADGVQQAAADSQAAVDAASTPEAQQAAQDALVQALVTADPTLATDPARLAAIAGTVQQTVQPLREQVLGANQQLQDLGGQVGTLADGAEQVSAGAAQLSTAAPTLADGIASAADGAAQLDTGAASAASGASTLADGLDTLSTGTTDLRDGLVTARDGSATLRDGLQDGVTQIPASTSSSRDAQADAIGDPVAVTDDAVTSAGSYGAGLAPFFVSLAAWIGMYALFLIVKPVSKRAITAVRAPLRVTLAGWATPFVLGLVQMVALFAIVTAALGFEVVHPVATVALMVLASAAFAAIILTLNVWLGSVGQFLGLVLMVVQLVTAGGTFPWQTLPTPLAALHHALPMSYATDGLRQLMYGGSTATAGTDALVLAAWLLGALLLSWVAVRRATSHRTLRDLRPSLIG